MTGICAPTKIPKTASSVNEAQRTVKVFLSHSHADARLAARISVALQRNGLEVWDTDLDVLPGDNWAAAVGRALEESEAMVVLLTRDAINSPNVRREIEYAPGAKRYSNRLIPVAVGDRARLPTHEIPWIVRRLPWVELHDREGGEPDVQSIAAAIRSYA